MFFYYFLTPLKYSRKANIIEDDELANGLGFGKCKKNNK
jgi:hypothetical protein